MGKDTQVTTQVTTQVITQVVDEDDPVIAKLLEYCEKPHSTKEIAEKLGYKERKTAAKYIKRLLDEGRLAMTIPDKPNSQNQKYVTIK